MLNRWRHRTGSPGSFVWWKVLTNNTTTKLWKPQLYYFIDFSEKVVKEISSPKKFDKSFSPKWSIPAFMEWLDGAEWFRRITRWQAAKNHPSASISRGASGGDLPSSAWRRWDKLSWCTSTRGKALRRCDRSVQYSRREKMPQIVEKLLNGTIDYGVHPPITNFLLFECRTKIDSSGKILLLHPPWFRRLTAHFSPKKKRENPGEQGLLGISNNPTMDLCFSWWEEVSKWILWFR